MKAYYITCRLTTYPPKKLSTNNWIWILIIFNWSSTQQLLHQSSGVDPLFKLAMRLNNAYNENLLCVHSNNMLVYIIIYTNTKTIATIITYLFINVHFHWLLALLLLLLQRTNFPLYIQPTISIYLRKFI